MATETKTKTDEPKQTLPPGHPQAGYVSPDLSTHEGTGKLPPEEVAWHEARNDAHDEEVERVEAAEDKAAKEEAERTTKEIEARRKWEEEQGLVPPAPPTVVEKTTTTKTSS